MEENMPQNKGQNQSAALWIILAVVVLIAVAAILYYSDFFNTNSNANVNTNMPTNTTGNTNTQANTNTATDIDTSDWKTYENTKYGYSFKYPSNWTLTNYDENTTDPELYFAAQSTCVTNYVPAITDFYPQDYEVQLCFNVFLRGDTSVQNWYQNYRNAVNIDAYESVETSDVSVNNKPAIKEKIVTGSNPNKNRDTENFDGILQSYYIIFDEYIISSEARVTLNSEELLEKSDEIVNTLK